MIILLDMDEIVVDMQPSWYRIHNERTGDSLSVEKVTRWDLQHLTPYGKAVFAPLVDPGFYENLPAVPGALEGIDALRSAGHRVLLVSSAPTAESMKGKTIWMQRFLRGFPFNDLVLTGAKDMVRGDVLFDDGPHNLLAYRAAWPSAWLATIERPYLTPAARAVCDLVAGDWRDPAAAWAKFLEWLEVRS